VRARNSVDTTSWSGNRTFITRDYVTLTAPANAALGLNINTTANWAPHTGVTRYQLQVDVTNLFNSGSLIDVSQNYINSTDGNSDTQRSLSNLQPNTIYFWRVRAINSVDTSVWTQRWFSTGNAPLVLPEAPGQLQPCSGSISTENSAALSWQNVQNATSYEVEVRLPGSSFSGNPAGSSSGTGFQLTGLTPNTSYCWRVRSIAGGLASEWSTPCCFTTGGASVIAAPQTDKTTYCSGSAINVQFSITGNFNQGNIFNVQLSDRNGNFNNPQIIGSVLGANPGNITAQLPALTEAGTSYKVRVTSSSPSLQSAESPAFTVNIVPQVNTDLNLSLCAGSAPVELAQGNPAGGTWSGPGVSNNTFSPQLAGTGQFSPVYTFTDANNCSGSDQGQILVDNCTSVEGLNADRKNWRHCIDGSKLRLITEAGDQVDYSRLEAAWYDLSGKLLHVSFVSGDLTIPLPASGNLVFQGKILLP
jgi:hypothetical protein